MKRWVMAGIAFAAALAAEAGSVVLVGGPELVSRKQQGDDPKTWCLGSWGDELETRVKKGNSVVIFADENPAAFRDPARRAAVTEKVKDGDFVVFALGPDESAAEEAMKEAARAKGAKTIRCDVPAMLRALAGKAGRDESLSWYRAVQDGSDFTHTTKRGARILAREFLKALERRGSPLAEFFNPVFRKPDGEAASVPAGGESLSFAPFCEADSAHMEARRTSFGARLAEVLIRAEQFDPLRILAGVFRFKSVDVSQLFSDRKQFLRLPGEQFDFHFQDARRSVDGRHLADVDRDLKKRRSGVDSESPSFHIRTHQLGHFFVRNELQGFLSDVTFVEHLQIRRAIRYRNRQLFSDVKAVLTSPLPFKGRDQMVSFLPHPIRDLLLRQIQIRRVVVDRVQVKFLS